MSDDIAKAHLTVKREPGGVLRAELTGDWLVQAGLPGVEPIRKELATGEPVMALGFDTNALGRWNTGLMTFALKCRDLCQEHHIEFRAQTLPRGVAKLIRLSEAVPAKTDAARRPVAVPWLARVGGVGIAYGAGVKGALTFIGENALALVQLLRGRAQFRWADAWLVIQQCGPEALGIVALINFLVGLILAFVGATQLARFGASIYVADLVAIATVREMGCLMTGIILCGRTGAAFAAQLGTMKVTQEIEAFQTFGVPPIQFLVLPRMVALILMMPLLCVFADLISLMGGYMVATSMLHTSHDVYLSRTVDSITLTSFLLGIFKGAYYGVVVALTGCLRGMQCGPNAAAVGQATTSAVVTGITAIIASDGLFAVLCSALHI